MLPPFMSGIETAEMRLYKLDHRAHRDCQLFASESHSRFSSNFTPYTSTPSLRSLLGQPLCNEHSKMQTKSGLVTYDLS